MPELDAVVQRFEAITTEYCAALEEAAKAADAFALANAAAASAVRDVQAAMDAVGAGKLVTELKGAADAADSASKNLAGFGLVAGDAGLMMDQAAARAGVLTGSLVTLDAELDRKKAALAAVGLESVAAGAALGRLEKDTNNAAGAARYGIGWWRLTGTAIHWIVAGSAELLAILVPATVAAGAWAAVWAQGATNVQQHMNAVYTATEADNKMFHETAGQAVGLGNALQQAQNKANPDVYQALGAAVNIVRERFGNLAGTGLQVGTIFDTFTAKLVYDMSAAGGAGQRMQDMLSQMVPDLVGVGQLFGNLGHAVLNFASDMPGLAEVLLRIADGASRVALAVAGLPAMLITVGMGFEEFNRWGGLAVGLMGRMGLASEDLSGRWFTLSHTIGVLSGLLKAIPMLIATVISNIGSLMTGYGRLEGGIGRAGMAVRNFGADLTDGIVAMPAWAAAVGVIAVAALGFLIYKIATAKTAAEQFAATLQDAADKASNLNVLNVLASDMGRLQGATVQANSTIRTLGNTSETAAGHTVNMAKSMRAAGIEINQQRGDIATYTAAQRQMAQQFMTVAAHATYLSGVYHTTLLGALTLADAAGVHLNQTMTKQAWAMAQIKIADLVQGYESMGQPLGVVGKDMTAVAIQTGLTATKVSQLNQAWDQFMTNLTGGTSGLAGFETSISNMGTGIAHARENLATYAGTFNVSMSQFATSLQSFTGKGAAAWTNFNQVVGSTAPQMIDWLRTAGAEGAISGAQFSRGVLEMVAQLVPLASKSKAAQTELLGLVQQGDANIKTFPELTAAVRNGHLSIAGLAKIVQDATGKMGDMAGVAQQLGNVMQTDIIAAMDQARLKVSGVSGATQTLLTDLRNRAPWDVTHAAAQTLVRDLEAAGEKASTARAMVKLLESQWNGWNPPNKSANFNINTYYQQHNLSPGTPAPFTAPIGGHPLAAGTPSARPGVTLVGEQGPELVSFRGGESVTPARETGHLLAMAAAFQAATSHGTPGTAARAAESSSGGAGPAGYGGGAVTVHVYGSVHDKQSLARDIQTALNQKTLRNGSTRIWIPGRQH